MTPDRIDKEIVLDAPLERVWLAISKSENFGKWFGVEFDGPFVVGAWLDGRIVPTSVDPDIAKLQAPHTGKPFRILVEQIEPMRLLSFRWHPYPIQAGFDPSKEPTTLVAFALVERDDGVLLSISERGFENVPIARRAQAFEANDGGWSHQANLIAKYLKLEGQP